MSSISEGRQRSCLNPGKLSVLLPPDNGSSLMVKLLTLLSIYCLVKSVACDITSSTSSHGDEVPSVDPKGYLFFCLCMGRFGNQVDHFLGALSFAKSIERTMVVPPWRTYKNVPFTDWFQYKPLLEYHRVIKAEDFMEYLAPSLWPPEERIGFCYSYDPTIPCKMKEGNPFQPFWDGLGVDFNTTQSYDISYTEVDKWKTYFPPDKYPVIALKGAPAFYPVKPTDRPLQKYLQWSDQIQQEGDAYIDQTFKDQKFIGIHLRNGADWERACEFADGKEQFMESSQCLEAGSGETVSPSICFPPVDQILRDVEEIIVETEIKCIYVATDRSPLLKELTTHLQDKKVTVVHNDPWLPQIDLYILGKSHHFIGNCVSSFTAFVIRQRSIENKPSSFWGKRPSL